MPWWGSEVRARAQELARLDAFADLSQRDLRTIAKVVTPVQQAAGETLTLEDEIADGVYVVLSGTLLVTRYDEEIRTLTVGDIVGEIGHLAGRRTATVVAQTDAELLHLSPGDAERLAEQVPALRDALEHTARKRRNRDLHTE